MTAKEFLRQYRQLTERIRQLNFSILKLEEEYDSIQVDYSGMPHGSGISDKTADTAVKMADLKIEKVRMRDDALIRRDEVIDVISRVEDPVLSKLLYDRYVLFMTWEETAEDCDRSEKWCRTELHARALQCVDKLIGNSL